MTTLSPQDISIPASRSGCITRAQLSTTGGLSVGEPYDAWDEWESVLKGFVEGYGRDSLLSSWPSRTHSLQKRVSPPNHLHPLTGRRSRRRWTGSRSTSCPTRAMVYLRAVVLESIRISSTSPIDRSRLMAPGSGRWAWTS